MRDNKQHSTIRTVILLLGCLLPLWAQAQAELMPSSFHDTRPPVIIRPQLLDTFFLALNQQQRAVRIVHLGDSHVRGHVYSVACRRALESAWGGQAMQEQNITYQTTALATENGLPGLVYHAKGINGATYDTFNNEEQLALVASLQPDLIILSFGTNEAHGPHYTEEWHRGEMGGLVNQLRQRCPGAIIMLTTPPGSYRSIRVKTYYRGRKRYTYRRVNNQDTPRVVAEQLRYAEEQGLPVFDLYNTVGGEHHALRNWQSQNMLGRDGVHYAHTGYTLQGQLLAQALINARKDYDTRH